jgi:hypothetical protein
MMNRSWVARTAKLARGAPPALALALVSGAMLAGGGPALAAVHGTRAVVQHAAGQTVRPAAAGDISTVAGGPGGPAKASTVAIDAPCDVTADATSLYVAAGDVVQQVDQRTDQLSTTAGTGAASPLGDAGPATSAG